MLTHIKWIVMAIALLGFIALFIWADRIQPGSVFAGIATFVAAIKTKIFGNGKGAGKMISIQRSHESKYREWERERREYEQQYNVFVTRMDLLNTRIEELIDKLDQTSDPKYKAQLRSEEEILRWLKRN